MEETEQAHPSTEPGEEGEPKAGEQSGRAKVFGGGEDREHRVAVRRTRGERSAGRAEQHADLRGRQQTGDALDGPYPVDAR
ncbi:hypothetical protein [Streptomyces mirabilis]|uniref:hypothetical protein n=1 Tax=Streptomyces mirabilis TaxID=68239 RepID=UPI0036B16F42